MCLLRSLTKGAGVKGLPTSSGWKSLGALAVPYFWFRVVAQEERVMTPPPQPHLDSMAQSLFSGAAAIALGLLRHPQCCNPRCRRRLGGRNALFPGVAVPWKHWRLCWLWQDSGPFRLSGVCLSPCSVCLSQTWRQQKPNRGSSAPCTRRPLFCLTFSDNFHVNFIESMWIRIGSSLLQAVLCSLRQSSLRKSRLRWKSSFMTLDHSFALSSSRSSKVKKETRERSEAECEDVHGRPQSITEGSQVNIDLYRRLQKGLFEKHWMRWNER